MVTPTIPSPDAFRDAFVLTGPTGSGKSAIALRLAEQIGGEIVSMDSMTLYRGMDIGTAKPTPSEQACVPHHLIDTHEPWESASVAWWLGEAARCCQEIVARGRVPLIVGGTPLYLKALYEGLFEGIPADPHIRERLEAEAQSDRVGLHARLAAVDPVTANRLHVNDIRRVVRALEVWELTGKPISAWQQQWSEQPPLAGPPCLRVDWPRDELYRRINERVSAMLTAGWPEEVRRLLALPRPVSRQAWQALGYEEVRQYVAGELTFAEVTELIQTRTRQFAKRQLTWFRSLPQCQPVPPEAVIERFQQIRESQPSSSG